MAACLRPILLLGLLPLTGCAWFQPADRPNWVSRLRGPAPSREDDRITLDLAIIEKPLGDPFIDKELWRSVDDMIAGDLERKALLEKNGYRIGQVVGLTPEALQRLLKSERYCVNPRRRVVPAGTHVTQFLGPVFPQAAFTMHEGDQATPLTLDQARFCLDIVPTIAKEKIRLAFTPRVETGERVLPFQPDVERSTWTLRVEKPSRAFPSLSWEVTVEPNKYVVVGTILGRPDTLGHRSFTQDEYPPRQRLLVLRAATSSAPDSSPEEGLSVAAGPSLASQAAAGGR
ncbi:MAG: hypothetical protein U0793_14155 [Gemmataceae bacterium]